VCVPILERESGLRCNVEFTVGYSPERINPGDKAHRVTGIRKVTSGSTPEAAATIDALYASIIPAGTHLASSIRVAEAAKVIENTQRDVNIALVNELALIFNRMGIDTLEVLEAAGTKWNFLPYRPGLVGGHCIGVDPYYLTHKAELVGYHPEVILAGRRINDGMGSHIARKAVQQMIHAGRNIKGARVNVLGLTFKEDVPDIRNSKVADILAELREFGVEAHVHDPLASSEDALHEYGVKLRSWDELPAADALILAVSHKRFLETPVQEYLKKIVRGGCVIDVKSVLDAQAFRREGLRVWRL
jgi:UDP-N-acetyl-D-glucosamine/UDP-N-acetyl-D-galactosamine dehydrogenase